MAENTSTKKPRFLPDPSKWIQTAPSTSSAKKPAQRPLSAFRNAFATPTSIKRQNVASTQGKSGVKKQDSLSGFFTPPTASQSVVKKENGIKRLLAKDGIQDNAQMRGSPAKGLVNGGIGHTSSTIKKSKLYVRADGDADSDRETKPDMVNQTDTPKGKSSMNIHGSDRIAGPSIVAKSKSHARPRVTPLQSHRSAPVSSSSSGMSDALGIDQDTHTPPRKGKRKYNRASTSSPSPPLFDIPPPNDEDDIMPSHASSDRPITPVPDYVLAIHKRLCGRDSERMKRVKSPWRTMGYPTAEDHTVHHASPVKKRKTGREREREKEKKAIDERAHDQALLRRRNKENEGNKLVLASSQTTEEVRSPKDGKRKRASSPVIDITPLAPLVVNALHHTTSRGPPKNDDTPGRSARPLRGDHQAEKAEDPFSPSAVYREICGNPAKTTTPRNKLRRIPTGASPGSAIPLTSPSPIKRSSSPPAKSSSSTEPPQASSSTEAVPSAARRRDFKPVSMQPETLVSWNGGDPATVKCRVAEGVDMPIRPEPTPIQHRESDYSSPTKPQEADSAETQSLAPSVASQSFPNVIPSPTRPIPAFFGNITNTAKQSNATTKRALKVSPEKMKVSTIMPETIRRVPTTTRSIARFPTDLGVAETVLPAGTPSKDTSNSQTPRQKGRQSQFGWPATGFGLERTTPTNDKNRSEDGGSRSPTSAGSSSKKKRSSALTTHAPKGTQSKLASFGFFGEKPKKATKGFDESWEQEDDLPFEGEDDDYDLIKEGTAEVDNGGKNLQAVPLPPPHPALRPAGIRELRRREEQAQNIITPEQTRSGTAHYTRPDDEYKENEIDDINMNDNELLFPELSSSSPPRNHHRSNTSASASSTDDPNQSSSLTTEDELGMDMNASAAAWWDGLEDRRSSEFGSFVLD